MTPRTRPVRRSLPWLLAALSMICPFSIDAIFPGFPLIGERFALDGTALQQLISVYLLTSAQARVSMINGIPVFDLPGITVQPTDAERRAAALPDHRRVAGAALLQGLTGDNDDGSIPLSSSLTMPYYSFASEIGQISKD
jgi:hypothetical protein